MRTTSTYYRKAVDGWSQINRRSPIVLDSLPRAYPNGSTRPVGTAKGGAEELQTVGRDAWVAALRNQCRRIEGEITERGRF